MSSRDDRRVISIAGRFTEASPIEMPKPDYLACRHEHVWLDPPRRLVICRDCDLEGLDAFDHLVHLSKQWDRWKWEARQLSKLNAEYRANEYAKWVRTRDRHLNAHPDHRAAFDPRRRSWSGDMCRTCSRLETRFDRRWEPTPAPEPPPGKLS